MASPSALPAPRSMARCTVSLGMLLESALSTAVRRRGLSAGSGPPSRAATVSSRISLLKILPRLASWAALRCLILDHLLWPAMLPPERVGHAGYLKARAVPATSLQGGAVNPSLGATDAIHGVGPPLRLVPGAPRQSGTPAWRSVQDTAPAPWGAGTVRGGGGLTPPRPAWPSDAGEC